MGGVTTKDSQRLLLDEDILSCFLPCVNAIRPGPDLQCPVVTTASYSNYVETISLILSVHFRSMFNRHCTGFTILNTHTETTMPLQLIFIVKKQPIYNFRRRSHLFCATLYLHSAALEFFLSRSSDLQDRRICTIIHISVYGLDVQNRT